MKSAAITVRIDPSLRARLEARARREKRSLSAEIAILLDRSTTSDEGPARPRRPAKLLGRFEGARIPRDAEIAEVRRHLWSRLGQGRGA